MSTFENDPVALVPQRKWLLTGVGLTVAAVLAAGFFLYRSVAGPGRYSSEQQTDSYSHQLTALVIKADSGDVRLAAGPDGMVVVSQEAKWIGDKPIVTQQWNGDTLTMVTSCPETANCQVDLVVQIPAGAAVHADVASGDVAVLNLAGSLDLTSESGTFDLQHTSGSVKVAAGSGEITGSALRSSDVDARIDTGTIELDFAIPPTSATAATVDSGDVRVTVPRLTNDGYRVMADTGNGDRRVDVAQTASAAHAVTASTVDGNVTVTSG